MAYTTLNELGAQLVGLDAGDRKNIAAGIGVVLNDTLEQPVATMPLPVEEQPVDDTFLRPAEEKPVDDTFLRPAEEKPACEDFPAPVEEQPVATMPLPVEEQPACLDFPLPVGGDDLIACRDFPLPYMWDEKPACIDFPPPVASGYHDVVIAGISLGDGFAGA